MPTTYEFVVETLDYYPGCGDDPDIIDPIPFDTLAEAAVYAARCEELWRISLRRDTGNEDEGLIDRWYAYTDASGMLTERMEDMIGAQNGPLVPKRFRALTLPIDPRIS
jgi:hypothetical protein